MKSIQEVKEEKVTLEKMLGRILCFMLLSVGIPFGTGSGNFPIGNHACDEEWVTDFITLFDSAKGTWPDPPCYDFTYTWQGLGSSQSFAARVLNGEISGTGDLTIGDFFAMIESECFRFCPEHGAHKCVVRYGGHGIPYFIFIDKDMFMAGEELRYTLSGFQVVDCDSPPLETNVTESTEDTGDNDNASDIFEQPGEEEEEVTDSPEVEEDGQGDRGSFIVSDAREASKAFSWDHRYVDVSLFAC